MRSIAGESNPNYRHGGNTVNRTEYNSWRAMIARCNDPKYRRYDRYGGRGIKVCDRWRDPLTGFAYFLKDMGKKPDPKYTLDRVDNDGNYSPDNCRWASQSEQIRNSTIINLITLDGIEDTVTNHVKRTNTASLSVVYKRVRLGWSYEEAIMTPGNVGRLERDRKRKQRVLAMIPDCLWCGEKVGNKAGQQHKKYCNGNHYMLHRMNPTKTVETYV